MTPDTRFRIGSASTGLTSAAVGVLLEKGRLKLDDEIQTYVPQFPKERWPVTLRQLMGHVSGVTTDSQDDRPLVYQRCERPADALRHFADRDLLFEPGTQYRQSKYGWILLSAAIEAAADQVRFGLAIDSGTLLQPATVQMLQTSQQLTSGRETGYGLGWDLDTVTLADAPTQAAGHDGESSGGKVVSLVTFRERGVVVAVMANISHADTSAIALRVAEAFAE